MSNNNDDYERFKENHKRLLEENDKRGLKFGAVAAGVTAIIILFIGIIIDRGRFSLGFDLIAGSLTVLCLFIGIIQALAYWFKYGRKK